MMDRRSFVTASAVALTGAGALHSLPAQDPHVGWFEQWKKVNASWEGVMHGTPEGAALCAEDMRLSDLITKTPARTIEGAKVQIELVLAESDADEFQYASHPEALKNVLSALKGLTA